MAASNHNGTWTLTHEEYQKLKYDSEVLARLKAAGVDNWEGYNVAFDEDYEDGEY